MIKVFRLTECDWWAGEDIESASDSFVVQTGCDVDEYARELTEHEMNSFVFMDELPDRGERRTFAEQLQRMIDRGDPFPCFFASTEY